jgi:hypothetical protein
VVAAPTALDPIPVTNTNRALVTNYFAVTAVGQVGLESDYSVEVFVVGTPRGVVLAWDPNSTNDNVVSYRVYWGTNSRAYKQSKSVTNTTAEIVLREDVYMLSVLSATNILGPWKWETNLWTRTNITGSNFYKLELKQVK